MGRSLEVGYTGMHEKQDFQVRGAAIRCLRKMGVPLEIIQRGAYAIEKAIDRHYLVSCPACTRPCDTRSESHA